MNINSNTFVGPSFSFKNRTLRAIWNIIDILLFKTSPRPFHKWRAGILSLFGAKIGLNCHVYPSARIWAPWNLIMQDHACIGDDCRIYNQAPITIGKKSVVSQNVHLCTGTHDYTHKGFPLEAYPIHIGPKSWIAADCFVGPNVTIGEGTVVGARSVVLKNLPEWHVCAGHPCVPKKPRTYRHE